MKKSQHKKFVFFVFINQDAFFKDPLAYIFQKYLALR